MIDPNKIKKEITDSTFKILSDMGKLLEKYQIFRDEIESRFKRELQEQEGRMDGLEDFYSLRMFIKRNAQNVNSAFNLLRRMKDLSGFDIADIGEEIEAKKMEKILK